MNGRRRRRRRVADAKIAAGRELFNEKVFDALTSLEEENENQKAVYVSSGFIYSKGEEEGTLKQLSLESDAINMIRWPMAHNVRPAGWSLGVKGCTECHSESGLMFTGTVQASGPGPDQKPPITMATLQGIDPDQRLAWNELFRNRASFKYVVAGSIISLAAILLFGIGLTFGRAGGRKVA